MPTIDREALWQRAVSRWAEIQVISPDLASAVTLQRDLVGLLLDAADTLDVALPADLTPAVLSDKSHRGVPALRGVVVPIPDSLEPLMMSICGLLAEAGPSAVHLRDALAHHHIDACSLLSVSLARNQKAIRTSSLHMDLAPDLVWLVGELASSPLAYALQSRLGTVEGWTRGYCPACGSWPVFIESTMTGRVLRCSFCTHGWTLETRRCIYCGNAGEGLVTASEDVRRADRKVDLCAKCGHYTKVIEVNEPTPFPLTAIEDLATMDLDVGAMNRGYRRPELADLDDVDPLPGCV